MTDIQSLKVLLDSIQYREDLMLDPKFNDDSHRIFDRRFALYGWNITMKKIMELIGRVLVNSDNSLNKENVSLFKDMGYIVSECRKENSEVVCLYIYKESDTRPTPIFIF